MGARNVEIKSIDFFAVKLDGDLNIRKREQEDLKLLGKLDLKVWPLQRFARSLGHPLSVGINVADGAHV